VIGKNYAAETLGYYNKGKQLPSVAITSISGSLQTVLFPAFSAKQDNTADLKKMIRRTINYSSYILFPLLLGLVVIAKPLILLLLTSKWLPSVPYFQLYCIIYMIQPIAAIHLQAMNAIGKSDKYLLAELIKRPFDILVIILAALLFEDAIYIAISFLAVMVLTGIINSIQFKRFFGYTFREQIFDVLPATVLSLVMAAAIYCLTFTGLNSFLLLLTQTLSGCIIYFGLSKLFKIGEYIYFRDSIKDTFMTLKNAIKRKTIHKENEETE